jgi:hypothetical protein
LRLQCLATALSKRGSCQMRWARNPIVIKNTLTARQDIHRRALHVRRTTLRTKPWTPDPRAVRSDTGWKGNGRGLEPSLLANLEVKFRSGGSTFLTGDAGGGLAAGTACGGRGTMAGGPMLMEVVAGDVGGGALGWPLRPLHAPVRNNVQSTEHSRPCAIKCSSQPRRVYSEKVAESLRHREPKWLSEDRPPRKNHPKHRRYAGDPR